MPTTEPKTGVASGAASTATMSTPQPIFTPIRDKPAGFGEQRTVSKVNTDGVKPITVMDAEMVDDDEEDNDDEIEHDDNESPRQTTEVKKKRRKGSKKKSK